ncbi:MAG: LysR family transcriptional regulator [Firmicutes bacterium]|nr:LysR family transcriptional regulator [Bacillota bacterium]
MTLQQLHYIIVISETGSMNKASEILYVSQPSLTSAVRELEKELGITIFLRSGRGVTLTNDGSEFLVYARQVYQQYEILRDKYHHAENIRQKFAVSTQHYSFAVKAFVSAVQNTDMRKYEFALRETTTFDVIQDVGTLRSEIGILYLSDFNRKIINRLLKDHGLEFHGLIEVQAFVYLYKDHPLAGEHSIRFDQLKEYPALFFEQKNGSFYYSEEILSTNDYERMIHTCDRATNLNLMVGLNAYTLCSGIICEELNGEDFVAIPFEDDAENKNSRMEIGYITKKHSLLSHMGERYIQELKKYLADL